MLEAASGKAIADAEVTTSSSNEANRFPARTDPNGDAQLKIPAAGGALRIQVEKAGWCPLRWDLTLEEAAEHIPLRFALRRAGNIGGVIRDEMNKPAAGVRVSLHFPQRLSGPHTPVDDIAVESDASGQWRADFVPADAEYVHVDLLHPDYAWEESQPPREALLSGKAVFSVRTLRSLSGIVVSPDGQPVAGATVYRGNEWGFMGLESGNDVLTDSDGRFHFPPGTAGKLQVAAFAAEFGPVVQQVELAGDAKPFRLVLTTPRALRVRLTDLEGEPLAGAEAQVSQWGNFHYPPWKCTTGADGRFTISNAPAERLGIDLSHPGHMGLYACPVELSTEEQVIQLGPQLRLHGKVVDAKTGDPIKSFKIFSGWPRQVFGNRNLTNEGAQWDQYNPRSFEKGVFEWTFTRPPLGGTKEPCDILLRADADGYASSVSRIFKPTERDAECNFQLQPPVFLSGKISFADGSPASGAKIYSVGQVFELSTRNGLVTQTRSDAPLESASDGTFRMSEPTERKEILVWHPAGFAELTDTTLRQRREITLTRWCRVEGILKRGNQVAANEKVALCLPQEWESSTNNMQMKSHFFWHYETDTDSEGRFVFEHVPPGEVAVARIEPIERPQNYGVALGDAWGGCRLALLRLSEGQSAKTNFGGNGRTVSGKFVSTNGFTNWRLSVMRDLPPVAYPQNAEARRKWAKDWFWSEAGEPYRIWLGGTPQFRADGKEIRNEHPWPVAMGADGSFRITDLPPGEYTLSAAQFDADLRPSPVPSKPPTLTHKFTVPEGTQLPDLPPLEVGEFGNAPGDEPQVEVSEPTRTQPVTAKMQSDRSGLRAGESFELLVRLRIAGEHHINPLNEAEKPFIPTTLKLTLPEGIESVSDWTASEPGKARSGAKIYTDSVLFRRRLKILENTKQGTLSLKGELEYQACTAELCWPPKTISLLATIVVKQD